MNIIKQFNNYIDLVEESLNSPVDINCEVNTNEIFGYFSVDNKRYRIEFLKQIGNNWSYSFSYLVETSWSYNISHSGVSGFSVLSTIKSGLYEMYENYNPNSIIFSAIDSSDSRKRLYKSFCQDFCQDKNLSFSNRGDNDHQIFLMLKNSLEVNEKEEIMQSIKKIIEIGK
jgi:hypothetical protein